MEKPSLKQFCFLSIQPGSGQTSLPFCMAKGNSLERGISDDRDNLYQLLLFGGGRPSSQFMNQHQNLVPISAFWGFCLFWNLIHHPCPSPTSESIITCVTLSQSLLGKVTVRSVCLPNDNSDKTRLIGSGPSILSSI